MKLFFYELKKSVFKRSVFIIIIVFSIINIYKINELNNNRTFINQNGVHSILKAYNDKIYPKIKGKMTQESIDFIKSETARLEGLVGQRSYNTDEEDPSTYTGHVCGDYNLFKYTVSEQFVYAYTYPNTIRQTYEKALNNIEFYKQVGNNFEVRKNTQIKTLFFGREILEFRNTQNAIHIFDYRFSSLMIMLLLVFVLSSTFSEEKANGTIRLIKSTGQLKSVFHAKQRMSVVFVFFITAWFTIIDTISFGIIYNIDGWLNPIYSVMSYQYSPVNSSILGAVFISFAMKFCFFLLFSQAILFLSSLFKNIGLSFALSFVILLCLILMSDINTLGNPTTLLKPNLYFSAFSYVNVLGFAMPILPFSIFLSLFIALIIYLCNLIRSRHV